MPAITIRNLSDSVHLAIKQRAAAEKLSVEAWVRAILAEKTAMESKVNGSPVMTGFSEAPLSWPHIPANALIEARELWGALRGTVHIPPGTDLTAPLDEDWEAAS